jgi:SAM-dependent methyltransferase
MKGGAPLSSESYTPGHTENASDFMAKRTLESHGSFFLPYLKPGLSVLDCGCGPGSITMGIAAAVAPGEVVGIDFGQSQIERARAAAAREGRRNVRFETCDAYSLPFESGRFDRVFSHALMEHLADPAVALRELCRILKAGGVIGVCSPDWGGFILSPSSPELSLAVEAYMALQSRNGGDVRVGRKLGQHLAVAGFTVVRISARYECYPSLEFIGEYLALQLEREGDTRSAAVFRDWSQEKDGMFAQAWVSTVGVKPQ